MEALQVSGTCVFPFCSACFYYFRIGLRPYGNMIDDLFNIDKVTQTHARTQMFGDVGKQFVVEINTGKLSHARYSNSPPNRMPFPPSISVVHGTELRTNSIYRS